MIYFLISSLLLSFKSFKLSAGRDIVEDLIKTFFIVFLFCAIYLFLIGDLYFSIWLMREFLFFFFISIYCVFCKGKNRFEYVLIYFLLLVNVLHVFQSIIGYRFDLFYGFLDSLWLPGAARRNLVYSPGEFGAFFVFWFGIYFERLNVFIDEASTYAIINFALSVFLISVSRLKFAITFFVFAFFASMAKVFVILLPLFLFFMFLSFNFKRRIKLFVLSISVFIIIYPILVNLIVHLFFDGQLVLDLSDSMSARIYWTWFFSEGNALSNLSDISPGQFSVYDGYISKLPFFLGALFSLFLVNRNIFVFSLLFTLAASFQYGAVFFMGWLYYVFLISLHNFNYFNKSANLNRQPDVNNLK